jgi:hypothetical protein
MSIWVRRSSQLCQQLRLAAVPAVCGERRGVYSLGEHTFGLDGAGRWALAGQLQWLLDLQGPFRWQ